MFIKFSDDFPELFKAKNTKGLCYLLHQRQKDVCVVCKTSNYIIMYMHAVYVFFPFIMFMEWNEIFQLFIDCIVKDLSPKITV